MNSGVLWQRDLFDWRPHWGLDFRPVEGELTLAPESHFLSCWELESSHSEQSPGSGSGKREPRKHFCSTIYRLNNKGNRVLICDPQPVLILSAGSQARTTFVRYSTAVHSYSHHCILCMSQNMQLDKMWLFQFVFSQAFFCCTDSPVSPGHFGQTKRSPSLTFMHLVFLYFFFFLLLMAEAPRSLVPPFSCVSSFYRHLTQILLLHVNPRHNLHLHLRLRCHFYGPSSVCY